jgi:hypothetical protein
MNAGYPPLRVMAARSLRWAWRTLLEGAALYGASYYPMLELLDQQLNASAGQEERDD